MKSSFKKDNEGWTSDIVPKLISGILMTVAMLAVAVFLFLLAGCSKDDGPATPDPEPEQKSGEKQIISFRFTGVVKDGIMVDIPGQIDLEGKTIGAEMPPGTDISVMEPEVEISDKATYEPTGPQDFSGPINYTVTAEDGTSNTYQVTVEVALSQKEILLLISQANPNNTLDWDQDDHLSDWNGVTPDGDGKVVELELGSRSLTILPPEIGQLASLKVLSLDDNDLSNIPPEIGQLTNLEVLRLQSINLSAIPPEIGQLTHLERLYMGGNNLSAIPPEIGQLINLKFLVLSYNNLVTIPPEIWQLVYLEELWLQNNNLDAIPPEIGQLAHLERLSLGNNNLGAIPLEIGQLANLELLRLQNNNLSSIPAEMGQLSTLEELNLQNNNLSSILAEIGHLTTLLELFLAGNPDLNTIPASVCNLDTSQGGSTEVDIVPGVGCTSIAAGKL